MDDLLSFNSTYGAIICKPCQYALVPKEIKTHLQSHHRQDLALTRQQIDRLCSHFLAFPFSSPETIKDIQVPPSTPPIPLLSLYHNAFLCRLCPEDKPYVVPCETGFKRHLREEHKWSRPRGAPPKNSKHSTSLETVALFPISCQTFFRRSLFIRYFPVRVAPRGVNSHIQGEKRDSGTQALSIPQQIDLQLDQKLSALSPTPSSRPGQRHFTQISPWLDITQWTRYLQGHDLLQATTLIEIPSSRAHAQPTLDGQDGQSEELLLLLLESFDRVIEQARDSLIQDKVNVFDQHRVNSFIPHRTSSRPLWHKLKEPTYRGYKKVWKQLLCFVYRMVWKKQAPVLHCCLTSSQSVSLESVLRAAAGLAQQQESAGSEHTAPEWYQEIDRACLLFCISLLDHPLYGNIYDSVVVGFLAVLGINSQGAYHEATTYTPLLSAFVKISQLLVVQRSVVAAEEDEVEHPADILDVMQDRFMVYGSRSPMNWALKLRSYGKKIQDTTTSLGHIIWSDDGEELSYKGLELTMTALKRFVSDQVKLLQDQLHELLLVNPEENREDVVPHLNLRDIKDDPTIGEPGWNFLKDPRNKALHGFERWLLNRVANTDWLRDEFLQKSKSPAAKWNRKAAEHYLRQVDNFLHRLLLLVYIVSGQPPRGTELLSLLFCNTAHGLRRNTFMENGLMSFVTFYHKGYSIQGSAKIIHRYLPKEISELVVYYLWLILPFANQLRLLALNLNAMVTLSPFLWALQNETQNEQGQYSPWPSSRLSDVLKREFRLYLHTECNIPIWRHGAIAISRRHLKQAKFKKDYDIGTTMTWNDAQAGHMADLAGSIYARGIEEAPGHLASARAEYRQISRAWHSWLGFALYLGNRAGAFVADSASKDALSNSSLRPSLKRKPMTEIGPNERTGKKICGIPLEQ